MKYPMKKKTENPLFNFMVRFNNCLDYYLFKEFDEALKKAQELSFGSQITLLYEVAFNNTTREFFGQNTFSVYDGYIEYDKHAVRELHLHFYVNAGKWLNPRQDWIDILNRELNQEENDENGK